MARAANSTVIARLRLREEVNIPKQLTEVSEGRRGHPNVLRYIDSWGQDSLSFITTKFLVRSVYVCPHLTFVLTPLADSNEPPTVPDDEDGVTVAANGQTKKTAGGSMKKGTRGVKGAMGSGVAKRTMGTRSRKNKP